MNPMLLQSVEMKTRPKSAAVFPFNVPFVKHLTKIEFRSPITFLVGENGSGKSTFLESIACAIGSVTVGGESVSTDKTLAKVCEFALDHLKLTWTKRTKKGFFMRSEDFFSYAKKMSEVRAEMEQDLADIEEEYKGRSLLAKNLAQMPFNNQIGAMQQSYGEGLDSNSHGEGFFKLFKERFVGEGVYLLDEPEAPLSPSRQLALMTMLKMMIDKGGQFIIATHSPILLAYPDSQILSFDDSAIQAVAYDDLEHVTITRSFLSNPQAYLKHLLA
jgi:predicted ATPase